MRLQARRQALTQTALEITDSGASSQTVKLLNPTTWSRPIDEFWSGEIDIKLKVKWQKFLQIILNYLELQWLQTWREQSQVVGNVDFGGKYM